MAKFLMIDHSLQTVGGHHFQYASQVLQSAEKAGFDIYLAVHQKFSHFDAFPSQWHVLPSFQHTTYAGPSQYFQGYRSESAERIRAWPLLGAALRSLDSWSEKSVTKHRRRLIAAFSRQCAAVFDKIQPGPEDQVFLPTASELDLMGLADFLRRTPASGACDWHVQFHFDVMEDRSAPDVLRQKSWQTVQAAFARALEGLHHHRLFFYTTTATLAKQYNRLDVTTFDPLPYPALIPSPSKAAGETFGSDVSSDPAHVTLSAAERLLKISCPGHLRAEKGRRELGQIVEQSLAQFDDNPQVGIQFRLQVAKAKFQRHLAPHVQRRCRERPIIDYVPFPLAPDDYTAFLRSSDLGLLAYQRNRYFARASGILVEMLSAGVPVLVPAGCWLSEQIAEPAHRYLDRLVAQRSCHRQQLLAPCTGPEPPARATNLVLSMRRAESCREHGVYVRVTVEAEGNAGTIERQVILGHRENGGPLRAAFRLPPHTRSVRFHWEDAFGSMPLKFDELKLDWLDGRDLPGGYCPTGAVGLAFARIPDAVAALDEMACHLEHYRQTARCFAGSWSVRHHPMRTIEALLQNAQAVRPAA